MSRVLKNGFFALTLLIAAGCAATNFEQQLAEGEQAVIFWAVEVVPEYREKEADESIGFGIPSSDRYQMWPIISPIGPGDRLVDADGDRIRNVPYTINHSRLWRDDDRRYFWEAKIVDPGTYSLIAVREQARFVLVGFDRLYDTTLLVPAPDSFEDPNYTVTNATPSFQVNAGEAVYIGTFVGTVTMRSRSYITTEKTTKSYRTDEADKRAVAAAARIDPSRPIRTVNLFDGKPAALRAYSKPHTEDDG
ncbi:MAG: hypothetical protein JJ899_12675 [Alphaproteobacteria bacterium]|nr:hypothetical protein [Alphaproteobacteria bacterium]